MDRSPGHSFRMRIARGLHLFDICRQISGYTSVAQVPERLFRRIGLERGD